MGRQHRVGILTPYREGTPLQMPRCRLQHFVAGSVIDGNLDINLRNLHVSHDSVACQVQACHVFAVLLRGFRYGERIGENVGNQGVVETMGPGPLGFVIDAAGLFHLGDFRVIAADQLRLSVVIPFVCH